MMDRTQFGFQEQAVEEHCAITKDVSNPNSSSWTLCDRRDKLVINFPYPSPLIKPFLPPKLRWPTAQVERSVRSPKILTVAF